MKLYTNFNNDPMAKKEIDNAWQEAKKEAKGKNPFAPFFASCHALSISFFAIGSLLKFVYSFIRYQVLKTNSPRPNKYMRLSR